MKILAAVFSAVLFCTLAMPQGRVITAAQANGTYRYRQNEIKILALGHNQLRIQMDLVYEYKLPSGPMANTGEAAGEAMIENEVATFHPSGSENCTITIKFLPGNKIKVTESPDADCGFGMNVSSNGTYTKIRAGKPKFDPDRD